MYKIQRLHLCLLLLTLITPLWAEEKPVEQHELALPPESLAQWYKPANKRQVWLHTMFRLRREMQAVSHYADQGNQPFTLKWAQRLRSDYHKISEMVPEWEDLLEERWADRLQQAAQTGDFETILLAQKKLTRSCEDCHDAFRALAATLYRVPDYGQQVVTDAASGNEIGYPELMQQLSRSVNLIKIASEDGQWKTAQGALEQLNIQLDSLAQSCGNCHQDDAPGRRILGSETQQLLTSLKHSIQQQEKKETGKLLGKTAVVACARCHSTHRTLGDMKQFLKTD